MPRSLACVSLAALVLAAVSCGGAHGGGSSSAVPATQPASPPAPSGWKRCTSTYHGFSIAYPERWQVASYDRLRVLGAGTAYRRRFFRRAACLNYDPRPFTVYDGSEWPATAIVVHRAATARDFRNEVRWRFDPSSNRTILRRAVMLGGHPAIRFSVYQRRGLWERSTVYGYLIGFGRSGGIVVEAWRYGFKPIPLHQYRANMAVVDRMAPTARILLRPTQPKTAAVVYLMRGEHLAAVSRRVAGGDTPAGLAMSALLRTPSSAERSSGLATAIPAATRLLGVTTSGGLATVDLTRAFESGGGSFSMQARVAQVVYTLTRVSGISRIAFELDGQPVTAVGGEGVLVSPPVGRAAFESMAPAILVESPLPGQTVTSPLRATGSANVFEASFVIQVADWDGRVIAQKTVQATSGTGTRGTFATTIAFPIPGSGPARLTLIAYEPSARDGSPTHEVEIPLTLAR